MATTLKQKTGESYQEILERNEKHLNGQMSDADFRAAQKRLDERTTASNERLLEIGRSFLLKKW